MKKSKKAWKVTGPYVDILGDVYAQGDVIPANTLPEIDEAWLQDQGHISDDTKGAPVVADAEATDPEEETD